jgi:hypothetical protein
VVDTIPDTPVIDVDLSDFDVSAGGEGALLGGTGDVVPTDASAAAGAVPDSVQLAIDSLREQGIPGIFGGNFDLTALQKQIADYLESIGYQAPGATDQQQTAMPVPGRAVVDRVQTPMIMR